MSLVNQFRLWDTLAMRTVGIFEGETQRNDRHFMTRELKLARATRNLGILWALALS